jgi:hypothetical protein
VSLNVQLVPIQQTVLPIVLSVLMDNILFLAIQHFALHARKDTIVCQQKYVYGVVPDHHNSVHRDFIAQKGHLRFIIHIVIPVSTALRVHLHLSTVHSTPYQLLRVEHVHNARLIKHLGMESIVSILVQLVLLHYPDQMCVHNVYKDNIQTKQVPLNAQHVR